MNKQICYTEEKYYSDEELSKNLLKEDIETLNSKGIIESMNKHYKFNFVGIVSFRNILASEIMTPRVDIKALTIDTNFVKIVETINNTGHSRFPLYENDLDKVIGILYAKDILPFLKNNKSPKTI